MLFASQALSYKVGYKQLGQINTPSPAFVSVESLPNQKDFLLISQFGVIGSGKISVIPDIGAKVASGDFSQIKSTQIQSGFAWPNEIQLVPNQVFGRDLSAIVVPDGFLVPFHNNGNIFVLTTDPADISKAQQTYQLTEKKSGYFYHTGRWLDLNGDGRLDYLTARSNAKANQGELLWLEHPEEGLKKTPWTEHVITTSPDVQFEVIELPEYPNSYITFTAEFFSKKLQVYQISKNGGQVLNQKLIDGDIDQAYSVQYLDLDNDGVKELLVNNHESDNSKAGVFVYTVPKDLFNGEYTKKTIASGFKNVWTLTVPNMTPGFPYAVYPDLNKKEGAAHILIAGDGDYSAHLLRPESDGSYTKELIKYLGGTVGSITYGDSNNNGWLEFYVPNYDKSYIEVYEFYDLDAAKSDDLTENKFLVQ